MPTFNGSPATGCVNTYCTLADFRSSPVMNWPASDTSLDSFFCDIITAASRAIDQETSRYFYKSSADETRYFTAKSTDKLFTGDLVSVTSLYTDTSAGDRTYPYTWSATDYDLFPYDAATATEAEPYRWIDKTPLGLYQFPVKIAKGVKIIGKWGWPAVPSPIAKACLLYSYELYKYNQTPLSEAAGQPITTAQVVKLVPIDPRVKAMIANYALPAV